MCRQGVLPNEFPAIGKNHHDPGGEVGQFTALDQVIPIFDGFLTNEVEEQDL